MWISEIIGTNIESGGRLVWLKVFLFTGVVKGFLVNCIGQSIVHSKTLGGKPGTFFNVFICSEWWLLGYFGQQYSQGY
jgi:hypothetical protein